DFGRERGCVDTPFCAESIEPIRVSNLRPREPDAGLVGKPASIERIADRRPLRLRPRRAVVADDLQISIGNVIETRRAVLVVPGEYERDGFAGIDAQAFAARLGWGFFGHIIDLLQCRAAGCGPV